ncbi:MAG TPA: hypothetical protein VGG41_03910 [Solirubrobacteraceae bacterium]
MSAVVPGDVEEADELVPPPSANPAQAVAIQLGTPIDREERVLKPLCMKSIDLTILKVSAPLADKDVGLDPHADEGYAAAFGGRGPGAGRRRERELLHREPALQLDVRAWQTT